MNHIVTLSLAFLLVALVFAIDVSFVVIAIDRLAQSGGHTDIQVIPTTDLPTRF